LLLTDNYEGAILFPFLTILLIFSISFRIRQGQNSKQLIRLEKDQLLIINSLFPFRFKKKHLISSLEIESTKPWNILTGSPINTTSSYARLIINKEKKLYHFYNEQELKELVEEFKSGANIA
jgi:hypothetical protein